MRRCTSTRSRESRCMCRRVLRRLPPRRRCASDSPSYCGANPRDPETLRPNEGSPRAMDTDVNLCKVEDVPDGGKKHFEIMGYDILVVRLGDRFFCVDEACTYKWAMLKDCNGAWDLSTGQPKEAPAKFPLTVYRVEAVGDDLIVTFTY